jgi:hypothetical protein
MPGTRPHSAEMVEGETNKVEYDWKPIAGANTLTSVDWECSGLTFATEAISGLVSSAFVSGGTAGIDYIVKLTAVLSSGETKVRAILLEWKAPGRGNLTGVE